MKKVLVPAILSLALFACGSTDKEMSKPDNNTTPSQTTTTAKELTREDDVTSIKRLEQTSTYYTEATVSVLNHSSKTSNYLIEITAVSPDGSKQYGGTYVSVGGLEPAQTADAKAMFSSELPADAVLKAKKVTRYAS